ncbi:hypothetical protein Pgin04_01754 [Porphyromonas gingivalis]
MQANCRAKVSLKGLLRDHYIGIDTNIKKGLTPKLEASP